MAKAKKEFNKCEVLERHRNGEKVTAIAEAMGVSKTEVYTVIRELKRAEEWNGIQLSPSGAAFVPSAAAPMPVEPRVPIKAEVGAENVLEEGKNVTEEGENVTEESENVTEESEKPAPKKRGRKKKTGKDLMEATKPLYETIAEIKDENKPDIDEIKSKAMEGISDEDKSDADIEAFTDDPAQWAARKYEESKGKAYTVKFKDGTELNISGVREITDSGQAVAFKGASGKAVVVSAAELLYYYPDECKAMFNNFSVE